MIVSSDHWFTPGSAFFTTGRYDANVLLPDEVACIRNASPLRAGDFCTGRYCARKALEPFDHGRTPIARGDGNEPVWPAGITGSISHTAGLAGAVVASRDAVVSLGLDIELTGAVGEELWSTVFTPAEARFLQSCRPEQRPLFSTGFFSMKESFYKLQFPLTRKFLEFNEVEIAVENGNVRLIPLTPLPSSVRSEMLVARWKQVGGHVVTLCALRV